MPLVVGCHSDEFRVRRASDRRGENQGENRDHNVACCMPLLSTYVGSYPTWLAIGAFLFFIGKKSAQMPLQTGVDARSFLFLF